MTCGRPCISGDNGVSAFQRGVLQVWEISAWMPVVCMKLSKVLKGTLASSSRGIALQESARGSLNMIVNDTSSY